MLWRNAWRDLWQARRSFFACALLAALAVTLYLTFLTANQNLDRAREATYQKLKFLDLSFDVQHLPVAEVERLKEISGVKAVEGRTALPCELLLGGANYTSVLIGLPSGRRPAVNDVEVLEGSYLYRERGQLLLEARFAHRHRIDVSDRVTIELDGRESIFEVVGLVSSPEYLWLTRDRFEPLPSPDRFAVAFVGSQDLRELYGPDFNQVHARLATGADLMQLQSELRLRLERYLVGPPIPRENQASHSLLMRDRRALRALGTVVPHVFAILALMMLFFSFYQLLSRRRREIGILMSQGFSSGQMLLSYIGLSSLVMGAGAAVGTVLGAVGGELCTRFYVENVGLPVVVPFFPWAKALVFLLCSWAAALLATTLAVNRVLNLQPAAALRSEFSPTATTLFRGLRLPVTIVFPLRNLLRQPARTLVAATAITFAVAQVMMVWVLRDSQRETLDFYFKNVHRYDLEVPLRNYYPPASLPPVHGWEGVKRAEYHLRVNAVISHGARRTETLLWGVPEAVELLGLVGLQGDRVSAPRGARVVMGPTMASRLGVEVGRQVEVVLEGDRESRYNSSLQFTQPIRDPFASPPVMALSKLQHIMAAQRYMAKDAVNVILLKVEPEKLAEVKYRLRLIPQAWGVVDAQEKRAQIEEMLRTLNMYLYVLLGFAACFTVVILSAAGLMNIAERTKELAILACLGFPEKTVVRMLLLEVFFVWLLGNLVGMMCGVHAADWLMNSFQSELVQMEPSVSLWSIIFTATWSAGIYLLASTLTLPRLRRVPLGAAVQERLS